MSVPDDPFNSFTPARSAVTTAGDTDTSPENTSRATYTPSFGPTLNVPGNGSGSAGSTSGTGTFPGTGAKTPRRVQWTSHVVDVGHPPIGRMDGADPSRSHRRSGSGHGLDEQALHHLTTELTRHQSLTENERNKRPRFVVGHDDEDEDQELESQNGEEDYDYRLDTGGEYGSGNRRYHRSSSVLSSGQSSMMSIDEETFRRDNDRAGDMGNLEKTLTNDIDPRTAGGGVHPSAVAGGNAQPIGEEAHDPFRQLNDVVDEMPVFVDPGETDGLPNMPPSESAAGHGIGGQSSGADDNAARASALVKAHRSGKFGGFMRNRKNPLGKAVSSVSNAFGGTMAVKGDDEKMTNGTGSGGGVYDEKRTPPTSAAPSMGMHGFAMGMGGRPTGAGALAGGGVLASLLALYDNGQPGTGTSTPASSRPPSIMPSDSSDSEDERERRRRKRKDREARERREKEARRQQKDADKAANEERRGRKDHGLKIKSPIPLHSPFNGPKLRQRTVSQPPELEGGTPQAETPGSDLSPPNAQFSRQHKSASSGSLAEMGTTSGRRSPMFLQHVKKAADRLGLDMDGYERPKSARNDAGVFGALVQSTGHLAGAATPAAASIAPDPSRPGYHLSRYSANDVDEPRESTSRPGSMYARSETPGTAERHGDGSPTSSTQLVAGPNLLNRPATTDDRPSHIVIPPRGKPNRPFSVRSFQDLASMPLTPGGHIKNYFSGTRSQAGTPPSEAGDKRTDYFQEKKPKVMTEDDRRRKEWEAEKKKRKKAKEKKKQQEIYIIQHVAAILARQQFIMKLTRAFMMFGSPSHRLEAQIQATARVLELNCQCIYFPGVVLLSFNDEATHTSETKFLKQGSGIDLGKLLKTHHLYWGVVHDKLSAEDASKQLDVLMTAKPYYPLWAQMIIGGMCGAFICCVAFYGSFIDALISIPLGMLLVLTQILASRNDLFNNVFEIGIVTVQSFLSAALASTDQFCYTAVTSASIVLILPGFIVLSGSLELASRQLVAGSVRIGYAVIYSLFLGFGITIGGEVYRRITGEEIVGNGNDWQCSITHPADAPWYRSTVSPYWYFLIVPGFSFWMSLRNGQPLFAKELPAMVLTSCAGWSANHFSALAFPNRADITSAIGSFVVGTLSGIWGKFYQGQAFGISLVGILFQLPSGLGNGGLFNFATENSDGSSTSYASGFTVAQQLVQVAIGLTVGLFLSVIVLHPFGAGRKRGSGGVFAF